MELRRDDLVRAAGDVAPTWADRLAQVEQEMRQAQAEALGRTGERLQGILDRLAALDRRLEAEAWNRLRNEALRVRHQLIVQREALGLARRTPIDQCYPVPERRSTPGPSDSQGRES